MDGSILKRRNNPEELTSVIKDKDSITKKSSVIYWFRV